MEASNEAIKGQEIVLEDLRQKCLWNSLSESEGGDTSLWWSYISRVHKTCYSVINEDCSKSAFKKLELDWNENAKCVRSSFTSSDKSKWTAKKTRNTVIDSEISYWKEFGTNVYPSLVINQKTYRGQIEPAAVYNALCAAFKDPPTQCLKTLHREPTD